MFNSKVEREEFLSFLANEIKREDNEMNVFWYGSSIYSNNCNDIDLMFIRNRQPYSIEIRNSIIELKKSIFHPHHSGFLIKNGEKIEAIVNHCLNSYNLNDIKVKFIFGPLGNINFDKSYLHIKGVISFTDFKCFSNYFPYHAKSIINNNIHLLGDIDLNELNSQIHLTIEELFLWAEILKRRLEDSKKLNVKKKCLLRLKYMIDMYKGNFSLMNCNYNLHDESKSSCIDVKFQNIYKELKHEFRTPKIP
ncbi:MAG: hypothetical protein LBG19_06520 [Prevotellaceae bacterium]|jgi:hypothetical protein|nr:hypothetical protein [Prevotellaceae bacterium]